MDVTISIGSLLALLSIMVVGAVIPGISVLTVTTRSISFGFKHGVAVTAGIILGDIIFILIAILGLVFLVEFLDGYVVVFKYLCGAYLLWLGFALWRSRPKSMIASESTAGSSLFSSFLAGFLLTLADQKAILFYLGFFPAFLDLAVLTYFDIGIIVMLAVIVIGVVKLLYAVLAIKSVHVFRNARVMKYINTMAGILIMSVGLLLIIRA